MNKRITSAAEVLILVLLGTAGMMAACVTPEKLCGQLEAGERPEGARARLEKFAARDPADLRSASWLAVLCVEDGDLDAAQEIITRMTSQAPNDYRTLTAACTLQLAQKTWPKAEETCNKALEASTRSARDLNLAAAASLKALKYDHAREILDEGLKKFPDDHNLQINFGFYHLRLAKYDTAIAVFKEVLAKDPANIMVRKSLGEAYVGADRFEDAAKELEAILVQSPDDGDALANLAIIYAYLLVDEPRAKDLAQKAAKHKLSAYQARIIKDIANGNMTQVPAGLHSKSPKTSPELNSRTAPPGR